MFLNQFFTNMGKYGLDENTHVMQLIAFVVPKKE